MNSIRTFCKEVEFNEQEFKKLYVVKLFVYKYMYCKMCEIINVCQSEKERLIWVQMTSGGRRGLNHRGWVGIGRMKMEIEAHSRQSDHKVTTAMGTWHRLG